MPYDYSYFNGQRIMDSVTKGYMDIQGNVAIAAVNFATDLIGSTIVNAARLTGPMNTIVTYFMRAGAENAVSRIVASQPR